MSRVFTAVDSVQAHCQFGNRPLVLETILE
jgi:hypothetical protein